MIGLRSRMRSFFVLFLGMAVVAIALSAIPTAADLNQNQQSEFCLFADGRELKDERTGDCAADYVAVAGRFLLYFAFFGGALLGPFGLYLVMVAAKKMLTSSGRKRGSPDEEGAGK